LDKRRECIVIFDEKCHFRFEQVVDEIGNPFHVSDRNVILQHLLYGQSLQFFENVQVGRGKREQAQPIQVVDGRIPRSPDRNAGREQPEFAVPVSPVCVLADAHGSIQCDF
jgi:hypothetical protein